MVPRIPETDAIKVMVCIESIALVLEFWITHEN